MTAPLSLLLPQNDDQQQVLVSQSVPSFKAGQGQVSNDIPLALIQLAGKGNFCVQNYLLAS